MDDQHGRTKLNLAYHQKLETQLNLPKWFRWCYDETQSLLFFSELEPSNLYIPDQSGAA